MDLTSEARRESEVLTAALAEALSRSQRLAPFCGVHLHGDRLELHAPQGNGAERARVVAAGVDLAAIARAVRRRGHDLAIERLPEGDGGSLVARLRIGAPARGAPAPARAAFTPLDEGARALAAELVGEGDRLFARGCAEVPSYLAPFVLRRSAWAEEAAARDRAQLAAARTLGAITTPGDARADWLAAGEAFEALRASAGGAVHLLNHPLSPSPSRARLAERLPGVPQLLVALV